MPDTLFVNKPGGVIARLNDGTSTHLTYGTKVPDNLASFVDTSTFADTEDRHLDDGDIQRERDAHERAALTEGGQLGSSSSPIPANYTDLDEDAAAQFIEKLANYPAQQAVVLKHERLYGGNRKKVIDAAGQYAQIASETSDEPIKAIGGVSVVPGPDPLREGNEDKVQQAALKEVPPPSNANNDDKLTGEALDARGQELEIDGFSDMKADEKRAAIKEAEEQA